MPCLKDAWMLSGKSVAAVVQLSHCNMAQSAQSLPDALPHVNMEHHCQVFVLGTLHCLQILVTDVPCHPSACLSLLACCLCGNLASLVHTGTYIVDTPMNL